MIMEPLEEDLIRIEVTNRMQFTMSGIICDFYWNTFAYFKAGSRLKITHK